MVKYLKLNLFYLEEFLGNVIKFKSIVKCGLVWPHSVVCFEVPYFVNENCYCIGHKVVEHDPQVQLCYQH